MARDTGYKISKSGECDTSVERIASVSVLVERKQLLVKIHVAMKS